jgi:pyruvate dehydrogenase E1 component
MTDEQIDRLKRGGHDLVKIHAAYAAAARAPRPADRDPGADQEGLRHGHAGQGRMTTHQQKKLDASRPDRVPQPLRPAALRRAGHALAFYRPADDSPEMRYLHARRAALGGAMPQRRTQACDVLPVPRSRRYAQFALQADGKEMSTTMAFVRMLTARC